VESPDWLNRERAELLIDTLNQARSDSVVSDPDAQEELRKRADDLQAALDKENRDLDSLRDLKEKKDSLEDKWEAENREDGGRETKAEKAKQLERDYRDISYKHTEERLEGLVNTDKSTLSNLLIQKNYLIDGL